MYVTLRCLERRENFEPIYSNEIWLKITGENADVCKKKIYDAKYNHDVYKYTPWEIVDLGEERSSK